MNETRDRDILDCAAEFLRQAGVCAPTPAAARSSLELPASEKLARSLDWGQPRIGDMPPRPPTLRARLGAALVRLVRRGLFWYSDQILAFQRLVATAAEEQVRTLSGLECKVDGISQAVAQTRSSQEELALFRQEVTAELQRLSLLVQESRQLTWQLAARTSAPAAETSRDGLTLAHADAFRGAFPDIRERLRVYLPYARAAIESTGRAPVLDLGCGRGEWLDLMREEGFEAKGVGTSADMVQACHQAGLDVEQEELLSYLRQVPSGSQAVLTAFHVVEHLTWSDLLEVIDQAVRVLKPGGVAIFETPNARNLQVASYTFHLDPSHVRPVPCELLSFAVQSRGLCEPQTVFLHPYPDSFRLDEEHQDAVARFINQVFYGPQDYAIIAKKA